MADIARILKKRKWTGRDLGIIELTNMSILYRQSVEGVAEPVPVVDRERFQKMLNSIRGSEEGRDYNGYISIYDWIRFNRYLALAHEQQAQLQIETLNNVLSNALITEPLISFVVDKEGDLTMKQLREALEALSMDSLFLEDEEHQSRLRNITRGREALNDSYAVMHGFNVSLDLIAELYNVPEVEAFKTDLVAMDEDIKELNRNAHQLRLVLEAHPAGEHLLKERKLKMLEDLDFPFDFDRFTIPAQTIDQAREMMGDYNSFIGTGADRLQALLFFVGVSAPASSGEGACE